MSSLIVDTGAWLLALAGEQQYMDAIRLASEVVVPGLVLAEVDYHLRRRRFEMFRLLGEIESGSYVYEPPTVEDLARAEAIDKKFSQLSLGLVDASIAALAERLDLTRLLTTDSDFVPLRIGPKWTKSFELVVAPHPI